MALMIVGDASLSLIVLGCLGFVATGTALLIAGLASAGATTAANLYSAHKQNESNDQALDYTKHKDTQDLNVANATQHANYDQWAAREQRMSSLGQMVGLPARNIPAFSPLPGAVDRVPGPNGQSTAQATGDPQAYFNSLFPGQTLTPDMLASQEQALNAKGIKLLRNAAGRPGKIVLPNGSAVDVIQGAGSGQNLKQWLVQGGGGGTPTPFTPNWANGGGYLSPMSGMLTPNAPGLSAPQPWQPTRTMSDLLR